MKLIERFYLKCYKNILELMKYKTFKLKNLSINLIALSNVYNVLMCRKSCLTCCQIKSVTTNVINELTFVFHPEL